MTDEIKWEQTDDEGVVVCLTSNLGDTFSLWWSDICRHDAGELVREAYEKGFQRGKDHMTDGAETVFEERIEEIAQVAYAVSVAYGGATLRSEEGLCPLVLDWNELPAERQEGYRVAVRHVFEHPKTTPQQMHMRWVEWMNEQGWTYGPYRNVNDKTHPHLRHWYDLTVHEQQKDRIFLETVKGWWAKYE